MTKKIGIIGAMDAEVAILLKCMQESGGEVAQTISGGITFNEGQISGKSVVVAKSGIGKVNAALCAEQLILRFGVSAVINTGIAGALGGDLRIFDMAVSTDAVYHDMDAVYFGYKPTEIPQMKCSAFPADRELIDFAKAAFKTMYTDSERKMVEGRIATGDQFISSKEAKAHIKELCNPICVEMEGAAIAHACYLSGIPYVILRCISDMADDTVEQTYSFNENTAAEMSAKVVLEVIKNV